MSWSGWLKWLKHQIHAIGCAPPPPRRPAPAMQRSLHRLEALLEEGTGRHLHRQRPVRREQPAPLVDGWASAAVAAHFAPRPEGVPTQLVVIALDASNRPVRNYTGTARLSSSTDPAAARPGDYTFTAEDFGGRRFSVTLSASGSHAIAVTDAAAPANSPSGTPGLGTRAEHH